MNNTKIPYVSNAVLEYLNDTFTLDYLLTSTRREDANYRIGYIKGVTDLIGHLKAICDEQDEVM
jgi:hypothetical protein